MQYSNPTLSLTVENWPYGRLTTTTVFKVTETNSRGVRIGRQTLNPKTGK